jgi:transcriptional regulator with XRE-family HTH domain
MLISGDDRELIAAVKDVRRELRESQQAFAARLGISLRSVAHYEKDRPPHGRTLLQLVELAREAGLQRHEELFRNAAYSELGGIIVERLQCDLTPRTDLECLLVGGLLWVLRNTQYATLRGHLLSLLRKPAQEYVRSLVATSRQKLQSIVAKGNAAEHSLGRESAHALRLLNLLNESGKQT